MRQRFFACATRRLHRVDTSCIFSGMNGDRMKPDDRAAPARMSSTQFSVQSFLLFIAALAAVLTLFQALQDPTGPTRREVAAILLSDDSKEVQAERLEPYVKLGDHIAAVKKRLTMHSESRQSFDTHVEVTFMLKGVRLELHHTPLGEIIGIKKDANGQPPEWLAVKRPWPGPKLP